MGCNNWVLFVQLFTNQWLVPGRKSATGPLSNLVEEAHRRS